MLAVAGAALAFVVAGRVEFDMTGGFARARRSWPSTGCLRGAADVLPLAVGLYLLLTRLRDVMGGCSSPQRLWLRSETAGRPMGFSHLLHRGRCS